jgi:methanogenic corrinoid protein MtbC1
LRELLTPKQVATAIGVSEASMKRWCDKGLLRTTRTAGGHRRLQISNVVQFIRTSGHPLVRPEILGLPSTTGKGEPTIDRAQVRMREALEAGDEQRVWRVALDLYIAGQTACEICDKVIAPSFNDIGDRWQRGDTEIYQERRAGEICRDTLVKLREIIPPVPETAPLAIGCTLSGDPYFLGTAMVGLVLREIGWQADSYGVDVPVASMITALGDVSPRLAWVSICHVTDIPAFVRDYTRLYEFAAQRRIAVVVGGRVLTEELRKQIQYCAFCDSLSHLTAFAKSLNPASVIAS